MANTISVLFWLRRARANNDGQAPLMMRLTFGKSKVEKAIGYYVDPKLWNAEKQRLKGNSDTSKLINK
jgi:hypothetical protein